MSEFSADINNGLLNTDKFAATQEWVRNQNILCIDNEIEDSCSIITESSIVESSDDDFETDEGETLTTTALGTQIVANDIQLQDLLNVINSVQTVGNVKIENSKNVHIGNITNINGNIQIIQHRSTKHRVKKSDIGDRNTANQQKSVLTVSPNSDTSIYERGERAPKDAFLDHLKFKKPKHLCPIVPRRNWLAQMPMEDYDYIEEPVKCVVISHTATESSEKQAINISIIRHIQCFHIESREWIDIAYNFLIGCDGNVYEGRGWGVVGAHTMGYNSRSIGISFIGCFMRVLPNAAALNACKNLLKKGVEEGHIASDYKLFCHCQCCSTESPGRKLFEEIKTWDHFYNIEDEVEEEPINVDKG